MFELEEIEHIEQSKKDHSLVNNNKISCQPLYDYTTSGLSYNFYKTSANRIEIKRHGGKLPYIILGLIGFGLLAWTLFSYIIGKQNENTIFGFISLPLIGIAIWALLSQTAGVFDKKIGWFWKGPSKLNHEDDICQYEESCQLKEIVALQIIKEYVEATGDSEELLGDYYCYELNLITDQNVRFNLLKQGKDVAEEAETLAKFLKVPIWLK